LRLLLGAVVWVLFLLLALSLGAWLGERLGGRVGECLGGLAIGVLLFYVECWRLRRSAEG
jgi:hypothetical protein